MLIATPVGTGHYGQMKMQQKGLILVNPLF
jgi:hypothetical protein